MTVGWQAWGTTVRVDVTDPDALAPAVALVRRCVADAERAADVDRRHAELHRLVRASGRPRRVSTTLWALVAVALDVAARTDGAVDPTVGASTVPLRRRDRWPGSGRAGGILVPACAAFPLVTPRPAPGPHGILRSERRVCVPSTVVLDLTATAKARTARLAAGLVADLLGVGAMVEVGGDVATAGPAPRSGWLVRPAHGAGAVLELEGGRAVASVRTAGIVDPLTGRTVTSSEPSVLVVGDDVVAAKAAAIRAVVRRERGDDALTRGAAGRAAPRGAGGGSDSRNRESQAS